MDLLRRRGLGGAVRIACSRSVAELRGGISLGGDHVRQFALPFAADEIRHRRELQAPRVLGHLASRCGGEQLRFVHHHPRGISVLARRVEQRSEEQRGEEQRGAADLLLDPELLEHQHDRSAMLPHPARQGLDLARRKRRVIDLARQNVQRSLVAVRYQDSILSFPAGP